MGKQKGFTLIELMITVAILAIVLTIAAPSFNEQIQNNRSIALGEDLATALIYARVEAVKRGRAVSLCASNADNTGCSNDSADWSNGWLVLLDDAADTSTSVTAGQVLQVWTDVPGNATVTVERATTLAGTGTAATFVRYTGTGVLARISNTIQITRVSAFTNGCSTNGLQNLTVGVGGMINKTRSDCE